MTLGAIVAKENLRQRLLTEQVAHLIFRMAGKGLEAIVSIDQEKRQAYVTLYSGDKEITEPGEYNLLGIWWEGRHVLCKHGGPRGTEDFHIFRVS